MDAVMEYSFSPCDLDDCKTSCSQHRDELINAGVPIGTLSCEEVVDAIKVNWPKSNIQSNSSCEKRHTLLDSKQNTL